MSVNILIISHKAIGNAVLNAAKDAYAKELPMEVRVLEVPLDSNPETLAHQLNGVIEDIDHGDGVLVLTDLYGSTPCNTAQKMAAKDNIRIITGLNLPMLIKVLNYPKLKLDDLAEKARRGGRAGIIACSCGK